jgi:diguanylate cyclase (GGDEF)-like protein/PAS domain S-box-containing protein
MNEEIDHVGADAREQAAESILRAHPHAAIAAANELGLYVRMNDELIRDGRPLLQGRGAMDLICARDRVAMLKAWEACQQTGVGQIAAELTTGELGTFHFFDLRERYGSHLVVLVRGDKVGSDSRGAGDLDQPVTPRFAMTYRNEFAYFIKVDAAATGMLGWTIDNLDGVAGLDLIHPDDQDRAVQNWIDMLTEPDRAHRWRGRHQRRDGSYVWIEFTTHNELAEHGWVRSELYDISGEMAAIDALHERERLLREVNEALPVGVIRLDLTGTAIYANRRSLEILGRPAVADIDDVLRAVETRDRAALGAAIESTKTGAAIDAQVQVRVDRGPDRPARHVDCRIRRLGGRVGDDEDAVLTLVDVTESVLLRRELEHRADTDSLTGALSRSATLARLAATDSGATLVYLDLDGFKTINDVHGHSAGDAVLCAVVERLGGAIGSRGVVGRLGGDEFVVIVPGNRGAPAALALAGELSAAVHHDMPYGDARLPVRASVGVSSVQGSLDEPDVLIAQADHAMYRSKQQGRGEPVLAAEGRIPSLAR